MHSGLIHRRARLRPRNGLTVLLGLGLLFAAQGVFAKAKEVAPHEWEGAERVVVLGDVHGDYNQYMKALEASGLVDGRGRWDAGETHFVQLGDIPDRGPDTRKVMDHLKKLAKEARRKGGRVHVLIGNHDAMMLYGDLRYVTAGEYEAFVDRNSERNREAQWNHHLATLEARDPDAFAAMDQDAFREEWEADYPLGWVEHRQAWQPSGDYGEQVLENPVLLRIDDTLFVHAGLSGKYCDLSFEEMTDRAHDELTNYDYETIGMIEDEYGPLWYRGLAGDSETRRSAMVDAILERYGAKRIVVGHSPTQGVVWPRFDGKVILNDVGMSAHYGGHFGYLELVDGKVIAHYDAGNALELPASNADRLAYLESVVALSPANAALQQRLERMRLAANAPASDGMPKLDAMSDEERAAFEQAEAWLSPDNCR
ncbi:MAG: metallophosphoesterase [Pseudomonadota bacterium]